ncbi:glycosyltransferase family 4 protein [Ahniella affigens]|nr:glycosyltransferase [Ahniella affigens]
MSVLISHTAAPPFLRYTAQAIDQAGLLRLAVIGLATRSDDRLMRLLAHSGWMPALHDLLKRKLFDDIPRQRLARYSRYEWARLLCGRLDRSGKLTDWLWDQGTRAFDRYAARQLRADDLAFGYEYGCQALFERAKAMGLRTVYEIPSAAHDWYHDLLARELQAFPDLLTPLQEHTDRLQAERSARRRAELQLADRVLVYSQHVVDSYRAEGVDVSNFRVINLGAPPVAERIIGTDPGSGPIRLVFAGTFGIRKGAHYLIQALEQFPAGQVQLDVYGSWALSESWRERAARVATLHGPVSFDALQQALAHAHALVLPSLSEAFGMVVTEALAQGTPVLVSDAVGAADLVQTGESGAIVSAGSSAQIKSGLQQLSEARGRWSQMREAARAAAQGWQWADHGRAVVNLIRETEALA